jgi:hypothetical protein
MRIQTLLNVVSSLVLMQMLSAPAVLAQKTVGSRQRASHLRLEKHPQGLGHNLYITVNGREREVTKKALHAWIIDNGRSVVYSWTDGSGGFENEGESLRIYDVATGRVRKILSEFVSVRAVEDVKLSNGQLALLVRMEDGGLGGSYFAVVDPKRGQVMYRPWAEATKINGDRVTLAFYREEDWDAINGARDPVNEDRNHVIAQTKVKPVKIEHHDLKQVLRRKVIHNKRVPM